MSRLLSVAAIQTQAHDRSSHARSWPAIAQRLREAARTGARLIVLPEGTLPAYVLGYERFDEAEIGAAIEECKAVARDYRAVVVVGSARRNGDRIFNSAIVVDADGTLAGCADKHFLWHFDAQWFAPGERLEPVPTLLGKLGVLICADGRIPTIARALVDRGAQILVMPTAWVTSGRDPLHLENAQADLLARVRARENDVPFVAANKCGVELGCVAYCGKSQVVLADGSVAAIAAERAEETLIVRIELRTPAPYRSCGAPKTFEGSRPQSRRIAITSRKRRPDDDVLLRVLQADTLICADDAAPLPDAAPAYPTVTDDSVLDPAGLVELRLSGCELAVWFTSFDPQWQLTFARARALELRMYLAVIDRASERAYAVDPDGAVICGTFGAYEVASFTCDAARTSQTLVAPGTDVRAGLMRAAEHAP